jgi:dihydrodipicolinate synthase/N-acetylneuraminate lyase
MITPFTDRGDIDEINLARLVEYLSRHVHGLFICGSYGSGPLMTVQERMRVAEITRSHVTEGVSVIAHVGTTNTRDTVALSRHAKDIGCDAVAAVAPYYFTHSEDDLLYYYSDLIKSVGLGFPVYVYNNPKFQGYGISLDTMRKLKGIGVHGVKDATFDILNFASYMRELSDASFDVSLGTEAMWLSARALGCEAYLPGLGNAFPELCVKMWEEGMRNEFEACRATQFLVNEIRSVMYLAKSTQLAVYAMVSLRGIAQGLPRAPFIPATEAEKAALRDGLEKIGVL